MTLIQAPVRDELRSVTRKRTRPIRALARVITAPVFVLGLWVAQLLFAKLLASPTRSAAEAGMGQATWFDDGHRLRAMVELFIHQPAVAATIVAAISASAIAAGLFSMIAAPTLLTRLSGERSSAAVLGSAGRWLPAMLVQTGYGALFRAVCTGLAAIPAAILGASAIPLVLLIASFPILVLDRARAAVVLDAQRPYHPMTFLRAIVHVGKRPLWWLSGTLIETLKLGVGVAGLVLILRADFAHGSVWIARVAGLFAIGLGLWRIALAVEDRA